MKLACMRKINYGILLLTDFTTRVIMETSKNSFGEALKV